MNGRISIIMYHYVRNLKKSRYPEIKGLDYVLFIEQLEYLRRHNHFLKVEDIYYALNTGDYSNIPPNSVLLTFDDGYIDHYTNVFPLLDKYKIQGCFFPPARVIQENIVLDVNKIHFILASVDAKGMLISEILEMLKNYKERVKLEANEFYLNQYYKKSRFDNEEVVFIKTMLQKALPLEVRNEIINVLFKKYVTQDEEAFSKELYMDIEQLKCMHRSGMYIGSHGYDHLWLNTLNSKQQEQEVDFALQFLKSIEPNTKEWIMCYPYGGYNDSLLEIIKRKGCKIGFSTQVGIADLNKDCSLLLPRLDTNDLPKDRNEKRINFF